MVEDVTIIRFPWRWEGGGGGGGRQRKGSRGGQPSLYEILMSATLAAPSTYTAPPSSLASVFAGGGLRLGCIS